MELSPLTPTPAPDASAVDIGPPIVGNERIPAGPAGVTVVYVVADLTVVLRVPPYALVIQFDPEAWAVGYGDGAVLVDHLSAGDHVVAEVVIVGVGGERQVGHHRAEMQHGRELDAELSGRV